MSSRRFRPELRAPNVTSLASKSPIGCSLGAFGGKGLVTVAVLYSHWPSVHTRAQRLDVLRAGSRSAFRPTKCECQASHRAWVVPCPGAHRP